VCQTNNSEQNIDEKIALRNNTVKIFVIVVFTSIFAVKLWYADLGNVLSSFDFNDLLALILALFAIWLSVLFYTKASETANVFYNNTYEFTKDMSVILGRIESGFGEKLDHLNQGYADINSAVKNFNTENREVEKSIGIKEVEVEQVSKEQTELFEDLAQRADLKDKEKKELFARLEKQQQELNLAQERASIFENLAQRAQLQEEERAQLLKSLEEHGQLLTMAQERAAMFESLAQRAKLEEEEKRRLFKRLEQQNAELDAARKEIQILKRKTVSHDEMASNSSKNYFLNTILPRLKRPVRENSSDDVLNHEIKRILEGCSENILASLWKAGLIDKANNLTAQGMDLVRLSLAQRSNVRYVSV
jgi:DNA repair exonuclease SbcCD ATPase subunit